MVERLLALETSSARLSLAVGDREKTLEVFQGPLGWRHAETLFEGLERLLKRRRWRPDQLSGIAVSVGPGSFTGIRIGLAVARTFGQVLRIPVIGVSALETVAAALPAEGALVCPMIDALRGGVFTALYRRTPGGRLRVLHPATHQPVEEWLRALRRLSLGQAIQLAGDALAVHAGILQRELGRQAIWSPSCNWYPRAEVALSLARRRLLGAGRDHYRRVVPLYLRQPAVLERRAARHDRRP